MYTKQAQASGERGCEPGERSGLESGQQVLVGRG